ncbi:hypothetical protein D3C85_1065480 [compost metagenome]
MQQGIVQAVDLDTQRPAYAQRVLGIRPPHGQGQVAARAGGKRAEQVDLGEELQVIASLRRAGLHEVHVVVVEAGALEDVQHVVHVELGQPKGQHRAGQVGMAVVVEVLTGEHLVDVGIAASAQQVVQAAAVFVDAVVGQAVVGDGDHGPQERQVRPEPVIGAHMGALQLAGARGPHALAGIIGVPQVEVPHLGAHRRGHAEHMAGRHLPGTPSADRYFELRHQHPCRLVLAYAVVKGRVDLQGGTFAGLVGGWIVFVHVELLVGFPRAIARQSGRPATGRFRSLSVSGPRRSELCSRMALARCFASRARSYKSTFRFTPVARPARTGPCARYAAPAARAARRPGRSGRPP